MATTVEEVKKELEEVMLKDEEGIMLKGKSPTSHLCLPHQPLFANASFLIIFVPFRSKLEL